MITYNGTLSSKLRATLNRRTDQLLEAQREIARLQQRVIDLKKENQLLSYRLAEVEGQQ